MSLELPPGSHPRVGPLGVGGPIPLNAKDSEFLQRRPDLFYPYLTSQQQSHLHTQFNGPNTPLLPPSQLQVNCIVFRHPLLGPPLEGDGSSLVYGSTLY